MHVEKDFFLYWKRKWILYQFHTITNWMYLFWIPGVLLKSDRGITVEAYYVQLMPLYSQYLMPTSEHRHIQVQFHWQNSQTWMSQWQRLCHQINNKKWQIFIFMRLWLQSREFVVMKKEDTIVFKVLPWLSCTNSNIFKQQLCIFFVCYVPWSSSLRGLSFSPS